MYCTCHMSCIMGDTHTPPLPLRKSHVQGLDVLDPKHIFTRGQDQGGEYNFSHIQGCSDVTRKEYTPFLSSGCVTILYNDKEHKIDSNSIQWHIVARCPRHHHKTKQKRKHHTPYPQVRSLCSRCKMYD